MALISLEADTIRFRSGSLSVPSLFGVLLVGLCLWTWRWSRQRGLFQSEASLKVPANETDGKAPIIAPLMGFNWETTEPLQFRPFRGKEKFNLTMGEIQLDLPSIEDEVGKLMNFKLWRPWNHPS